MTWLAFWIIVGCVFYLYMVFYLYQLFRNWYDRLNLGDAYDDSRQIMCGVTALIWPIGYIINAATFYGRRDFRNKNI